ncbi:MAG: hypothetical protein F4201_07000 [Nitrospira sp. SB0677_bin_15]|nr:hypothetical protein [Nitrospira sp. SB0677_bin_15]
MSVFRTHIWVVLIVTAFTISGCVGPQQQKPPMTPLEIQSIQTREYEAPKKITFASVVSVFQDLGYTIKNADLNTGFINAESASQSTFIGPEAEIFIGVIGGVLGGQPAATTQSVEQTVATAFIEEIKDVTRVRLNFVMTRQSSSAQGQNSRRDTPILDVRIYTNAFERIENAVFIRSGE